MTLPAIPKGSWISKELKQVYGAKAWKAGKGVDLNGNGRLEKNEKISTYNGNNIPGYKKNQKNPYKKIVGDWTDWLAFYRANYKAIHAKVGSNQKSIFFWAAKVKTTNPLHVITSIESPVVKHSEVLTAYKKTWKVIARARRIPIKGSTKLKRSKAKLLAVYTSIIRSGFKIKAQIKNHIFVGNMISGALDCDTASFIIMAESHERNWPVYGVHAPNHFFVRWHDRRSRIRFNFDSNSKKRFPTDRTYRKDFRLSPRTISRGVYLKNLKISSLISTTLSNRALAYGRLKKKKAIIRDLSMAIKLDPNFVRARGNRGAYYASMRKTALALKDFKVALKLNPRHSRTYLNRAALHINLKKYKLAMRDYNKLLAYDPKHVEAYYERADAYTMLNKDSLAIKDYSSAIKQSPKHLKAYYGRAFAYGRLGSFNKAIKDFSEVITLDLKHADAYEARAAAYIALGKYQLAINDSLKAVKLKPSLTASRDKLIDIFFNRGVKRVGAKNYAGAVKDFSLVLGLNSRHSLASHLVKKYKPCIGNTRKCP